MIKTATLPLRGTRTTALVVPIRFIGIDLTGAEMEGFVLQTWDNDPDAPEISLPDGVSAGVTGIRFIGVETVAGAPESSIEIVVAEADMDGIPAASEIGSDLEWVWYLNITPASGTKQRYLEGAFIIGGRQSGNGNTGGTVVRVVAETVTVEIDGTAILAPLVVAAEAAQAAAEAARDDAIDAADEIAAVNEQFLPAPTGVNSFNPANPGAAVSFAYSTTGTLSANTDYSVLGLIEVTPEQTYTLSVISADSWIIRADMVVLDADQDYLAYYTEAANPDVLQVYDGPIGFSTATFTVPTGGHFVAFTVGYFVDSDFVTVTAEQFQQFLPLVQLNEGSARLPYNPYRSASAVRPGPAISGPVLAVRNSYFLYVRTPFDAAFDLCERVLVGGEGFGAYGTMQPRGVRKIPRATAPLGTLTAFTDSQSNLTDAGDEAPPVWINDVPLGGTHGFPGKTLTATAHGKTNADVGSIWTDGAAKQWIIAGIINANSLRIAEVPGGTAESWTITETLTGTTLTHVSGATHTGTITFSSPVSEFLLPIVQNRAVSLWVDGAEEILEERAVAGQFVTVSERYGIPNYRALIDDLIARAGSSAAPQYDRSTVQTQVEVDATYTWRPGELVTVDYQTRNVQGYTLGKMLAVQGVPPTMAETDTKWLYAPGMDVETVTGFDLTAVAEVTGNTVYFELQPADWLDPANPPERLALIIRDADDAPRHAFMVGHSKRIGAGIPATRVSRISAAAQIGGATEPFGSKLYPYAVGYRTMSAGEMFSISSYRGFYDPTSETVNAVYTDADKRVWILDIHETLAGSWISLPYYLRNQLIGKKLTVFEKSASLTLHSAFIGQRGAQVTVTGGYGFLIAEIG